VARELNSVTDNPLILPEGESLSAGNFHGQPLAFVLDFLAVALAEAGSIAERRTDRLLDSHRSGLPPFLVKEGGLNSGFMVAQYTAAALVSENKVLSHPASVDSIPTSANQEDHVSMGMTAATKLVRVLDNVRRVVAIEYLAAAQALEFRAPLAPAKATGAAHRAVRSVVPALEEDRVLAPDVAAVDSLIRERAVLGAVARAGVRLRRRPGA
jgi:histidine ammonia-lyase